MVSLPSSIEAYLREAGFTGSEIIVLRKLLEARALTLRELAAKAGKSTGVLDQAMKKLMKKNIIMRETINDAPHYSIISLQPVLQWMQKDMQQRQNMLKRKHENFESFMRTMELKHSRPEMQYFEGEAAVQKAYMQLLEFGSAPLQYGPTLWKAEEDPQREFRVQYFRERRSRNIFTRVITHNTSLGRRSQSHDAFEFRKTILVDPGAYPFSFEKIIVGEYVACFYPHEHRACFIRFPEQAHDERVFFESMWNTHAEREEGDGSKAIDRAVLISLQPPPVPRWTRIVSHLRELILRPSSLGLASTLLGCSLLCIGILWWSQSVYQLSALRQQVLSIGATAALQLNNPESEMSFAHMQQGAAHNISYWLNQLRNQHPGMLSATVFRILDDGKTLRSIADADMLTDDAVQSLSIPERKQSLSLKRAIEDRTPSADVPSTIFAQATTLTAYIPLVRGTETAEGILRIVFDARHSMPWIFSPIFPVCIFLILFLAFVLLRMTAFNRSLYHELCEHLHTHRYKVLLVAGALLSLLISAGIWFMGDQIKFLQSHPITILIPLYVFSFFFWVHLLFFGKGFKRTILYQTFSDYFSRKFYIRFMIVTFAILFASAGIILYREFQKDIVLAKELESIAVVASISIDPNDLKNIYTEDDMKKEVYQKIFIYLNKIKNKNHDIDFIYIMRPNLEDSNIWEFVVDADSNFYISDNLDIDFNGKIDEKDAGVSPGLKYDISNTRIFFEKVSKEATFDVGVYSDQWGSPITAGAPIFDSQGRLEAIIAIDSQKKSNLLHTLQSFIFLISQ